MLMILFSTRRLSPLSLVITTLLVLLLLVGRKKMVLDEEEIFGYHIYTCVVPSQNVVFNIIVYLC
jgi:hypothetical protein